MNRSQTALLRLQSYLSWIFVVLIEAPIFLLLMRLFSVRVFHKENLKGLKPPFILVSNHLSLIDSWFGVYSVAWPEFLWKHWLLPWHLPEATNYFRGLQAVLVWLSRSIPIARGSGARQVAVALEKVVEVLKKGESVYIFPEGTRSRTGRIGDCTTGIGRIYKKVPHCTILPIYLRGMENVLPIGVKFPRLFKKIDVVIGEPVRLKTEYSGLRANKVIAEQIFKILVNMEKEYFESSQYRSKEIVQ